MLVACLYTGIVYDMLVTWRLPVDCTPSTLIAFVLPSSLSGTCSGAIQCYTRLVDFGGWNKDSCVKCSRKKGPASKQTSFNYPCHHGHPWYRWNEKSCTQLTSVDFPHSSAGTGCLPSTLLPWLHRSLAFGSKESWTSLLYESTTNDDEIFGPYLSY